MKKTVKVLIGIFMLILISLFFKINTVNAASASISASSTNVTKGQTVTVTGKVYAGAWNLTLDGAGKSKGLVGQTSTTDNASASTSISFTANEVGTYKISLKGDITDYYTDSTETIDKSITIKVSEQRNNTNTSGGSQNNNSPTKKPTTTKPVEEKEKSKDSSLKELAIAEGAITPEFNKDVKEYALTVPNEITSVNVTATPTDSKAKATVEGNTELKEGENTVTVTVTAENGNKTNYTIKVTRLRAKLCLQSLVVRYENENKELIEIPLNPDFKFDVTEYSLQELKYWVKSLNIDAKANLEGATIDIKGADNLQTGENTITITLKIAQEGEVPEGEEPKEETITYTIKVNKEKEPTILGKISNKFKAIFGGITTWYNNNQEKVILGALGVCIIALLGLSIYIVIDYNKYKDIIAKAKKLNEVDKEKKVVEETSENNENILESNKENEKDNKGKHF